MRRVQRSLLLIMEENLVKKWIDDLTKHGFMQGMFGDKSEQFLKEQYDTMMKVLDGDIKIIGGNYRLLATIQSDYTNLRQYCGWEKQELLSLLELFGFKRIEEVVALMNSNHRNDFMEGGKLKKEVEFTLTPVIW